MGEMQGKFANEQMYKRWKTRLIIIGSILLVVGIGLAVYGIINFIGAIGAGASSTSSSTSSATTFEERTSMMDSKFETSRNNMINGAKSSFFGIFLMFFGGIGIMVGISLLTKAFKREMASYGVATVAPVAKDVADYASDEIIPTVVKSIKDAKETKTEEKQDESKETKIEEKQGEREEVIYCSKCGAKNDNLSNFCTKCGNKIK